MNKTVLMYHEIPRSILTNEIKFCQIYYFFTILQNFEVRIKIGNVFFHSALSVVKRLNRHQTFVCKCKQDRADLNFEKVALVAHPCN